jgi:peroxiredoxin
MQTKHRETTGNQNACVDSDPPMALDKFIEQTGLSSVTIWRFRKKSFLRTINICGRHYVLRSEIARFNERALAGEFSKPCNRPLHAAEE